MSNTINLEDALDEIHAAVLSVLPPDLLDLSDVDAARARLAGLFDAMPVPELPDTVTISEAQAPGIDGEPDVRVKVYRSRVARG